MVLEPTCGEGAFLRAAAQQFVTARLIGYELNRDYVDAARVALESTRAEIRQADFFRVDWEREFDAMGEPILVAGNPPWVTNSTLGALGSNNLPEKKNIKGLIGLDALTGKSNFDVSEWMLLRLLAALQGRRATLAVLCKAAVARRVIEFAVTKAWSVRPGGLWANRCQTTLRRRGRRRLARLRDRTRKLRRVERRLAGICVARRRDPSFEDGCGGRRDDRRCGNSGPNREPGVRAYPRGGPA